MSGADEDVKGGEDAGPVPEVGGETNAAEAGAEGKEGAGDVPEGKEDGIPAAVEDGGDALAEGGDGGGDEGKDAGDVGPGAGGEEDDDDEADGAGGEGKEAGAEESKGGAVGDDHNDDDHGPTAIQDDDHDGDVGKEPEEDEIIDLHVSREELEQRERQRVAEYQQQLRDIERVQTEAHRQEQVQEAVRRLEQAQRERDQLVQAGADLQRRVAGLLARTRTKSSAATTSGDGAASGDANAQGADALADKEKQYVETLQLIAENRERLERQQNEYNSVALELQSRLDDKEYKATEVMEQFRDFKREIARQAENSRTGKPIPRKMIRQLELTEQKKDEDLEKVRLKNINLRMTLAKLEATLRSKEQLAEGLHLIDFEQLKIENQTLNEKIEERNDELNKLKRKHTATVQVLTHVKEKLQFVEAQTEDKRGELSEWDRRLAEIRDRLAGVKTMRDTVKQENATLRATQGVASSELLVVDFQARQGDMDRLSHQISELHNRYDSLVSRVEVNQQRTAAYDESGPLVAT